MRIGIDGGCLANRRGFGRFARKVVEALAAAGSGHEFVLLLDRPSLGEVAVPAGFEVVPVGVREAPCRAASARGRRRLGDLLRMGRAAARSGLDLIYFPTSYSFYPVWNVPRVVVTIHDTLPVVHPELIFPNWRGRVAWTLKERAAARWADRVVTVSEASRRDLVAWYGLDPGRVVVVPEGPDAAFRPRGAGACSDEVLRRRGIDPGARFLLYVGGLSPHKNLLRLIEAYARACPADVPLVLVGDLGDVFHSHVPELRDRIGRLGLGDRVRLTGFVPDEELAHLYSRCYALVQPSLLEGFGLPPLEAMACGAPVLYSRAGSLPEVVGEAGLDFEPTDIDAIAAALRAILADPGRRDHLGARALRRAARFTWSAAATALIACFESTATAAAPGRAPAPARGRRTA